MGKPIQILIVEDEMIIAANLSLQLTELGYEVSGIIPRAEEALAQIRQRRPDILLLDINLKDGIDGIEMAHRIQQHFYIPIIYLTANSDTAHFERAKATNPFAFISKPYKKLDLQRAIELTVNQIGHHRSAETLTAQNSDEPFILSDSIFVRHHEKMFALATFMSVVVWGLAYCSLVKLRISEPELERPHKAWGYPFTGIALVLCSIAILAGFAYSDRFSFIVIVCMAVLSYPIFRLLYKKKQIDSTT